MSDGHNPFLPFLFPLCRIIALGYFILSTSFELFFIAYFSFQLLMDGAGNLVQLTPLIIL
jgi:hypothetical protein